MWKSKRRKYQEALLEGIRDRLHDLLYKNDVQEQQIAQLQNVLDNRISEVKQCGENNKNELYSKISAVEENLNYYSMIHKIMTENKYINLEMLSLMFQNTDSKKVLIGGFFGADNLGDELMLQTLLSYFPKEKLSSITVMLCDNEDYSFYHLPGVNFIHMPKNKFDCNFMAQYFDTLIWGGGALIDDSDFSEDKLTLNNLIINLSKRFIAFDKKVIALGLSANHTINNALYIRELKYICEKSTYFSLRDSYSQNVLSDLGITNTVLLDDLVFFNKQWHEPLPERTAEKPTIIGIIWICYQGFEDSLKNMIEAIRLKFKDNYVIKLIPFYNCISTDIEFYKNIADNLEYKDDIILAPYSSNLFETIKQLNDVDYIINMRYHGMLISNVLNLKSLNICYDEHRHYLNKTTYLEELYGTADRLQLYSTLPKNPEAINLEFTSPAKKFKLPSPSILKEIINNAFK